MKADEPRQPLTALTKPNGTAGSTRPRHPLSDCCPAQPNRLTVSVAAAQLSYTMISLFLCLISNGFNENDWEISRLVCIEARAILPLTRPAATNHYQSSGEEGERIFIFLRGGSLHLSPHTRSISGKSCWEQPQFKPSAWLFQFQSDLRIADKFVESLHLSTKTLDVSCSVSPVYWPGFCC